MTRIFGYLAALMFVPLLTLPASGGERALIWELSRSSDTSYSARLGSRLPTDRASSLGAEVRVRGPDPRQFGNPVSLWGSMTLAEHSSANRKRSARLDARMDGDDGKRQLALSDTMATSLRRFDAELRQEYTLDDRRRGNGRFRAQASQTLRLSAPATGTVVGLRTSRGSGERRHTTIVVEQPLRASISLVATIDDPARSGRKSRVGASYRHAW